MTEKDVLNLMDETMEALYNACVEAKEALVFGGEFDFSAMTKINKALELHDELVKKGRENE